MNHLLKIITISILSNSAFLYAQNLELQGQLSAWGTVNADQVSESQTGVRYIPELSLTKSVTPSLTLDSEMSFNIFGSGQFHQSEDFETNSDLKPYRMWLRLSTSQFEARIGLQKINFGSASLLRPLMWFDRIDPRDPLQLTDGVYGLLLRYFFLNNANIWLWGLYGNDDIKGWEMIPSYKEKPEFGGRVQLPFLQGELGLSVHHRKADLEKGLLGLIPLGDGSVDENRIALDGKWDVEVGVWFESTFIHMNTDALPFSYSHLLNVGLDYTFGLGNGLVVIGEHFIFDSSDQPFGSDERFSFSALSLNYPLGLLDMITGMVYYDWENRDWYRFISFQRSYDHWQIYLMGFWNPDQFQIYQNFSDGSLFAGKGIQIMVVFNH